MDGASGSSSNSNGSGAGFMEGLERGVSAGASSVGSGGVEEVKVEGVVGGWRGRATPDFPPSSVLWHLAPCTEKNGGERRAAAWGGGGLFPIERVSRQTDVSYMCRS